MRILVGGVPTETMLATMHAMLQAAERADGRD